MNQIQLVLDLLAQELFAQAGLEAISPFFHDLTRIEAKAAKAVWLYAWTTPGSNPHRAGIEISGTIRGLAKKLDPELLEALEKDPILPSRRSMRKNLVLPIMSGVKNGDQRILAEVHVAGAMLSDQFIDVANAVIEKKGWEGKDLYITIDGHMRPFWGLGSGTFRVNADQLFRLSSSGRLTHAAVRNKKFGLGDKVVGKSVPKWDGTVKGHEWLHVTLHHWKTKESLPLVVHFRSGTKPHQMQRAMSTLEKLNTNPFAILLDKEFTHGKEVMAAVRSFADSRGTFTIGPMIRHPTIEKRMHDAWNDYRAKSVPEAEETLLYYCHEGADNHVVYVYTEAKLRDDIREDFGGKIVYKGEPADIEGIAFYSNRHVGDDEIKRFAEAYARRWAAESIFARHVMFMGVSQSRDLRVRNFGYTGGFLVLALYGAWRALTGCDGTDIIDLEYADDRSHASFFSELKGGLLGELLTKNDNKPPDSRPVTVVSQ